MQVRVLIFFFRPRRAVNAREHFILGVATPIRAGDFHQLEYLQLAGRRHMRAAAQIDEIILFIQRNIFARRDRSDNFRLVFLAHVAEELDRLITRHHLTFDFDIAPGNFTHALFNRGKIFGRKRPLIGEIVVKAVIDHRPYRHLGIGKQLLHRVRQQVRRRMAQHFQSGCILVGNDRKRCIGSYAK